MKNMKKKILITDDSEINRSILADMLKNEFEILEACNGIEAISILKNQGEQISLVLLDIVMPEMDGLEVLAVMHKNRWIETIPVIMITAENSPSYVERAYELGATDFISRPFDSRIVHRRVLNTIILYTKQKKLSNLIVEQIYEKEKQSSLMIEILSNIVEFRNGESGLHVLHIHVITELLLSRLIYKTDKYDISRSDINLIAIASALHDIGKIAIPETILNKPARLTQEEFELMKKHTIAGADMLQNLPFRQNEPLVKFAYQICRWHHERYDGKGYPDCLIGDAIPIAAQAVSLADVYDALVSKRVYKDAYSHETAIKMILNGECGSFNPILIECFLDIADTLQQELKVSSLSELSATHIRTIQNDLVRHDELFASERTLLLLEHERTKYRFFASMSNEVQFEYTTSPSIITLSELGAKKLGLPEIIVNPEKDETLKSIFPENKLSRLHHRLLNTTPLNPIINSINRININGELRWCKIIVRSMWSGSDGDQYIGAIGKLVDITDEQIKLSQLEQLAYHDNLTGLYNLETAERLISEKLAKDDNLQYAMVILDIDFFKKVNDGYGHLHGNSVLKFVADQLNNTVLLDEIAARIGGDEFLLFIDSKNVERRIKNLFDRITNSKNKLNVSISIGISLSDEETKTYELLFHKADQALYAAKRADKGSYRIFDSSMEDMFNKFTPIDSDRTKEN